MMNHYFSFLWLILPLFFSVMPLTAAVTDDSVDRPYLDAALEKLDWIMESAVKTEHGTTWPVEYKNESKINNTIVEGTAGIVPFLLEAYQSTGNKTYLDYARSGADHLLGTLDSESSPSLYAGVAGIGYALEETYRFTNEKKYRDGVVKCVEMISNWAQKQAKGVVWRGYDIISGNAGIGLFLLYIGRRLDDQDCIDLAAEAGQHLIAVGETKNGGIWWRAGPGTPKNYPNFSHGTSGIAYFLARLYEETGEQEFLDDAIAGARYLESVATTEGNIFMVFHSEPGNEDVFYLGWCHGPAGTARLFYQLYRVTGDTYWLEITKRCANAISYSGWPGIIQWGDYLTTTMCCGAAGISHFFLDLYHLTHDKEHIKYAKRVGEYLLWLVMPEGGSQEHYNYTGYNWGAAGIALLFLHLDAFDQGKRWSINLPDSPWVPTAPFDFRVKKLRVKGKRYAPEGKITATAFVKNLGDHDSTETTATLFLAKETGSFWRAPEIEAVLGEMPLPPVSSGKTKKIKFKTTIPAGTQAGKYYLFAQVDSARKSGDEMTYNNFLAYKSKIRIVGKK